MATATGNPHEQEEDKVALQELLSLPILLADRVVKSAREARSSKQDCSELATQVDIVSQLLRSAARLAVSTPSLYQRPLRRIASDITKNLHRAVSLMRKRSHRCILHNVFSITTTADFRKLALIFESSIGDMKWVLSILETDGSYHLSLPPIANNDPILAWVWCFVSAVHMGRRRLDKIDAASKLAALARDSDRNKKLIVEEGGISPLLKLLKEGDSSEAQIAASNALYEIANEQERVRVIVGSLGVSTIVGVLAYSPARVQISVSNLVARMADLDASAQREFVTENVMKPLLSILSTDLAWDVPTTRSSKTCLHSLLEMNQELAYKNSRTSINHSSNSNSNSNANGGGPHGRKDREAETAEIKLKLKVSCAEALWKLCRGSVLSSRKITELKGLACLAKIVEEEEGDLQLNSLMTIMEITAVAEANTDLRRVAFKPNSPPAKAVLDQLLKIIGNPNDSILHVPAIRSVGCLARTFPAKETRIIGPLIVHLSNSNTEVATEAAAALRKFVSPDNFNCLEHSKAILESDGVPPLIRLLRSGTQAQKHALALLCHLAVNAGDNKALGRTRALDALQGAAHSVSSHHPELRDLLSNAIHHLTVYQEGANPHRK